MCVFAATLLVLLLNVLWVPPAAYAASGLMASQTDISCNGGNNGTASVVATFGTGPYTYSWAPSGGTAATATGLAAGAYTATVTDAVGAQDTAQFNLTEPTALQASFSAQTNVISNGGHTGSATVSVSGGTGGYTYSWAPSGGTAATASGLAAGTYTVTVTDANWCSTTQTFTITQPAAVPKPVAGDISATVAYGSSANPIPLNLSGGAPTSVAVASPAVHGTASVSGTSITYTPTAGYSGSDTFTYTATNSSGTSAAATVTITVNAAAPVVSAVSPKMGPVSGGTTVVITGTGLTGASAVHFGATNATSFTVNSATQITATSPAGAAGTVDIRVTTAGGISATSLVDQFTYLAAQTITFANPGAQTFGTTPTLSASSTSGLPISFTSATQGVCTITSAGTLTFATAGACQIHADQPGNAVYSAAPTVHKTFTVNAVVPGAPTIGTAMAGNNGQASVSFTAPASTGGATITGYTVTSSPGGFTGTGAGSPITVTGLTNGTAYTFTVTATNLAGTGAASGVSNSVTPKSLQTITFNNPGAQNFGTSPTLSASSTSGLPVTFSSSSTAVCTTTSSGTLTFVSAGTCSIHANQPGNGAFLSAPQVTQSFAVIGPATLPALSINDVSLNEGNSGTTTFTFTVSLSAPSALPVTVNYATADGTAQAGTDYTAASGSLTIPANQTTGTISITVNGDTVAEPDETFFVNLSGAINATLAKGVGVGTIRNDDTAVSPPVITPQGLTAVQNAPYSHTLTASGGTAPYTFSVMAGAVPPGLALSPAGVLSGTPTVAGPFNFSVTARDSNNVDSAPVPFTIVVQPAGPLPAPSKAVSVAAGAIAEVDLTTGVAGGPFINAIAMPVIPATAGVASIVSNGGTHSLRFVPAAGFAGVATVQYQLLGVLPMLPGTITITVSAARANAAQDAEVTGLAAAQTSAAQRFTSAQITNFTQRLESLHGGGWGQSSFGLSLTSDDTRKVAARNGNGAADSIVGSNPLRNGMRTVGLKAKRVAQAEPASASLPNLPEGSAEQARSPWAFWVNGTISYGRERHRDADERYRFTTNGISAGVDYRVNGWITVGTGLGISSDRSRVGNNGTRSTADSTVAVAYASMRPMQGVFVDALLGYGVLNFDSHRYITATGDMATGSRDGKQLFGSIATGLEFYRTDWMWSPYARFEFSQAKLDAYTEAGPAAHALKYFEQTARMTNGVLGARAEGKLAVRWGHFMPQVRVEYARRFEEDNEAGLAYADLADQGPAYTLRGRNMDTGRWTVGFGGRLLLRSGVELGAEYTTNIDQSNAYIGTLRLGARVPF